MTSDEWMAGTGRALRNRLESRIPCYTLGMAEPSKRRAWFQLHLSTCVVLMVVAGVLLALNFRDSNDLIGVAYYGNWRSIEPSVSTKEFVTRGWPKVCWVEVNGPERVYTYWRKKEVLIDTGVAVAVLLGALVLCEWRVRRLQRDEG